MLFSFFLSSLQVVTHPITGEQKTKKKLGGAYPGQRPPTHAPYTPPASDFGKIGAGVSTATTHFIQYGGGNALVLGTSPNVTPQVGPSSASKPLYVSVTLPEGVYPGDTIHVKSPDGRINAICIPDGMYPGSTFTVEFADAVPPKQQPYQYQQQPQPMIPANTGVAPSGGDDGFVAGFNNPGYVPLVVSPAVATHETHMDVAAEPEFDMNPTATSSASYPTAPAYPAATAYPAPPKY